MALVPDVLSNPLRLNITADQRDEWFPQLLDFLRANPLELTEWLYGRREAKRKNGQKTWKKGDVRDAEKLILSKFGPTETSRQFLSILRSAAHLWSVTTRTKPKLPRILVHVDPVDNPFRFDYARAAADYDSWKKQLKTWIRTLNIREEEKVHNRELLLSAFFVSAVLYGGVLGAGFLVAIVRSIATKERSTFAIGGRIYIESFLTVKDVAEAERRVWLPDPLSAILWNELRIGDVDHLLAPVNKDGVQEPASDVAIYWRMDELVGKVLTETNQKNIPCLAELQRCAWEVGFTLIKPVLVAYGSGDLTSNSLLRNDIRRLYPNDEYYGVESDTTPPGLVPTPEDQNTQDWHESLFRAARSQEPQKHLEVISQDNSQPTEMRLVADFGVSLLKSISSSGKSLTERRVSNSIVLISRALGAVLKERDLATLSPPERKDIYLGAINRQPRSKRRELLLTVVDFDLYLVAKNEQTCPVPRSEFPWEPKSIFVDANLITHKEYAKFLEYLDRALPPRTSSARRKIVRLIVQLGFRAGLRRSELRRLRIEDLLAKAAKTPGMLHLVELQIRPRKADRLKTGNAVRRIPIGVLLSENELKELCAWRDHRISEGAKQQDYLLAIPREGMPQTPKSLIEEINFHLRKATGGSGSAGGCHLHHLRHSAHSWLFGALASSELPLFPDLPETNHWLCEARSGVFRLALYGHEFPHTRKAAFAQARMAGHSSFDVTAGSYIHLFPWLLAAGLEKSVRMAPDPEVVKLAARVPKSTLKRWTTEGDFHNVPARLYVNEHAQGLALEADQEGDGAEEDWAIDAWKRLLRHLMSGAMYPQDPVLAGRIERARYLMRQRSSGGAFRHEMEKWTPDLSKSKEKVRLPCPLKPPHARNIAPPNLRRAIECMSRMNPELVKSASGVFARNAERGAWVRFDSIAYSAECDRFVEFLLKLNIGGKQIELISGDSSRDSAFIAEWSRVRNITGRGLEIKCSGSESRNFTLKSALYVRPKSGLGCSVVDVNPAGYRFAMEMAFVAFGEIKSEPG
ncbi:MAG: tyrosine-type recombinase/integrase [Terracidiphilus sp.]